MCANRLFEGMNEDDMDEYWHEHDDDLDYDDGDSDDFDEDVCIFNPLLVARVIHNQFSSEQSSSKYLDRGLRVLL